MSTSTITRIGIIGAGTIGRAVAAHAAKAGHHVLISNSRGPETLTDVAAALGPTVEAVAVAKAADADLVVLAVPFVAVPDVAAAVGDWTGRTVVDATNQFATASFEGRADIGPLTGSEWVARHLPGAYMIKAFNAMGGAYVAAEPRHAEGRQVVFHAGDNVAVNADFAALIETFGFAPVYVGSLADGGRLLQLDGYLSLLHVLKQD
jgi:predicted dinucleotide-binding enzyme